MKFEDALKALEEGKLIRKENDTTWYTKHSVLEMSLGEIYKDFHQYDKWIASK